MIRPPCRRQGGLHKFHCLTVCTSRGAAAAGYACVRMLYSVLSVQNLQSPTLAPSPDRACNFHISYTASLCSPLPLLWRTLVRPKLLRLPSWMASRLCTLQWSKSGPTGSSLWTQVFIFSMSLSLFALQVFGRVSAVVFASRALRFFLLCRIRLR